MPETEVVVFEEKSNQITKEAMGLVVSDQRTLDAAGAFLTRFIVPLRKEIVDFFKPMKQKQDEAKKEILNKEREQLAPVEEAERILRRRMASFMEEQERKHKEEVRRQEQIARDKAEAERKERIKLEQSLGASRKEIKEIKAEPLYVPPVEVAANVTKPVGVNIPKIWTVEVPDKVAFIKHVAAHPDLAYLIDINIQFVKGLAVSQKADPGFPGIKCVQKMGGAGR